MKKGVYLDSSGFSWSDVMEHFIRLRAPVHFQSLVSNQSINTLPDQGRLDNRLARVERK